MDGETVKTFHLLPFKSKMIQGSSIIWTVLFKNKGGIGPPIRYKSLSRKLEMDTFGGAHHYNQEICSSFRWTPKFSIQKSAVKVHAKGLVFLAGEICPGANNGKRNGQRGGRCIKADSFFQVHFPEDLRWIFPMHSKDPHFDINFLYEINFLSFPKTSEWLNVTFLDSPELVHSNDLRFGHLHLPLAGKHGSYQWTNPGWFSPLSFPQ